jgi:hypothetical protein
MMRKLRGLLPRFSDLFWFVNPQKEQVMIQLGDRVRDKITGFKGIAVGRTEWLHGCTRIIIEPEELKDGKTIENQWFDDKRVEVLDKGVHSVTIQSNEKTGGPQNDPKPASIPTRRIG